MSFWRTELNLNNMSLGLVNINRGIFRGDSLSPLLFTVILFPLAMALRNTKMGYISYPVAQLSVISFIWMILNCMVKITMK